MSRWTISEDAYLATHFASAPMDSIIAATGRTKDAIYSRAKVLELRRDNQGRIGKRRDFMPGTPFRKGSIPWKTNLRDAIISSLAEHTERTTRQLRATSGASASSVWKACARLKDQNNLHIARWQPTANSPGNIEAVYRIGAGVDAEKPTAREEKNKREERELSLGVFDVQPVPMPVLGPWGCVWHTSPANAPAERIV